MKQLYQKLRQFMPHIFWSLVAIVGILMLVELAPKKDSIRYLDKIQHALIFLTLSVSGYLTFKNKIWIITIGLIIFGAIVELLQGALTTTRTADVNDWLADVAGVLFGLVIVSIYRQFVSKRLQ